VTIFLFSVVFFLVARKQRGCIARNLGSILPGTSRIGNYFRSFAVFWNFAWSMAEAARAREGQQCITWELEGLDSLDRLCTSTEGSLVLTAHMGNYDVAAAVFAGKFGRKFNAVRLAEKNAGSQAYMEKTRDAQCSEQYQIHYNRPDSLLGLELINALARGEVVAIQGDRVMADVSIHLVPWSEKLWRMPKGPFILALSSRAPIYPLFILRKGWRRYQILTFPPLSAPTDWRNRPAALDQMTQEWATILAQMIRSHWSQWFVLEDAFEPAADRPS
jgi:lauroyl/myristoyl acyltransferase